MIMKAKNVKAGTRVQVKSIDVMHWLGDRTLREYYSGIQEGVTYVVDADIPLDSAGDAYIGPKGDTNAYIVHHSNLRRVQD